MTKDFFEQLGDTLIDAGRDVGQKAKDVTTTMRLQYEIRSKESFLRKRYIQLGKKYYQEHKDTDEELSDITDELEEIADLKAEIAEIKGQGQETEDE